jgi:hypothetical protein
MHLNGHSAEFLCQSGKIAPGGSLLNAWLEALRDAYMQQAVLTKRLTETFHAKNRFACLHGHVVALIPPGSRYLHLP